MRDLRYFDIGGGHRVAAFGRIATFMALAIATPAVAQQPTAPTVEQRIGYEIGPIIVRAAVLAAQVEEARAIITQRDKTIADLQAQIAQAKADKPGGQ